MDFQSTLRLGTAVKKNMGWKMVYSKHDETTTNSRINDDLPGMHTDRYPSAIIATRKPRHPHP